uniref:OSIGBa0102I15.9 protein n=1 Tax=Oryza sativa TaxID=4530 RepID=Q01IV9_ORYSA|nr:OSIGBa0102I15.9 [Oryza sativa]
MVLHREVEHVREWHDAEELSEEAAVVDADDAEELGEEAVVVDADAVVALVERKGAMDRSGCTVDYFPLEYLDGVTEFMSFIQGKFNENVEILCPCSRCLNQKYQRPAVVKKHILMNGMETTYTRWIHHGESLDVNVIEHPIDMNENNDGSTTMVTEDDNYGNRLEGILGDLQTAAAQARPDVENQVGAEEPRDKESFLNIVLREAKRQLYPGCTKFSRFSFVVRLLHMKSLYRISNSAFSAHMKLLADAFPECNTLPKSYDEAKVLLKEMGLGYESIHVCYNNCVLFRKEYEKHDNCSPLVEDLLELWAGVDTYDAITGKSFKLRAAVLWCIHDYPALSTLSGRTTRGYFACLHCDKHPLSYALRSKIGYFGHFRFLPKEHPLRRNNEFTGLHESNDPPVKDVRPGKPQGTGKRKRSNSEGGHVEIWSRMVSLWKLPYWKKLKGKTKDTAKARFDLKDLGIKKVLQFREDGEMPHARYTLSTEQKKAFCAFLQEVKFPDGFASNISRCLNAEGTTVQGLKTHDCHILLQRILPAAMRGFLDSDIYEAIAELGMFFRKLCSRTLNKDVLVQMKKEIPIILVKLEKIFPPAFFDVMVHLAIHLPDEALLRGPMQYGWMYPIERRLYTLKRYVRNRSRPEGSIAEAYIADECLTFCSKYMDDVETRFNREPRNKGFSNEEAYGVDVFGHGVNFTSAPEYVYDENGIDQMILKKHSTNPEEVDVDIFSLACGPDLRVRKYSSCIVNGVRFNTVNRDKNKKTLNSGVMSQATHNGQLIDFFGNIKEIIQLDYNLEERSVVLFECDWFKLDGKRTALKDDGFFKSINVGSLWYKNDCFILATHATKVFYLPDTKLGENWQVVQTFDHRHLYNVSQMEVSAAAYQEDECYDEEDPRRPVSSIIYDTPLNRDDERGPVFEAAEIARLMKESSKEVNVIGDEDEDEEDDTLMEYFNEEDDSVMEVDSDDE